MVEEFSERSSIIVLRVEQIPNNLNKAAFKEEEECKICGIPFTKKGSKKHVW